MAILLSMASPAAKRTVIVVIILLAALILWEMRNTFVTPSVLEPKPVPILQPTTTVPIQPPPAPVKTIPKSEVPKKTSPKKTSPKPTARPVTTKSITPPPQPPQEIAPIETPPPPAPTEWQGNDTAITHPGEVVIHNDHQWIQFWAEHHPHEPAPDVDFSQSMVLGVFAGSRPADQFTIHILNIQTQNGHLVVTYQEKLPPPGTFAVDVTVYPYEIKTIPRSTLPVKFNKLAPINPNQ